VYGYDSLGRMRLEMAVAEPIFLIVVTEHFQNSDAKLSARTQIWSLGDVVADLLQTNAMLCFS